VSAIEDESAILEGIRERLTGLDNKHAPLDGVDFIATQFERRIAERLA
jgi:hypothetical protein